MTESGEIMIGPSNVTLYRAVREAEERINTRLQDTGHLVIADEELGQLPRLIASESEGWRDWAQRSSDWRYRTLAELTVVWWADHVGRKHVGILESPGPQRVWPPGPARPPLACLYPQVCAERRRFGRSRLVAVCGCGAWGSPQTLAWMGPCCGPCFDRGPQELAPATSWCVGGVPRRLAMSPDARLLACWADNGTISLWDTTGPRERGRWEDQGDVVALAFSATGAHLGWASPERARVDLHHLESGRRITGELALFAFHPSGRSVFLYMPPDALVLWDMDEERQQMQIPVPPDVTLSALSCSPDGRYLLGATAHTSHLLWNARTGRGEVQFELPGGGRPELAWAPDGTVLVSGREQGAYIWDVHGSQLLDRLSFASALIGMGHPPEGEWLITCGGALQAWSVRGGGDRGELTFPALEPTAFALSPDGRTIALGGRDGTVRLLPAEMVWAE